MIIMKMVYLVGSIYLSYWLVRLTLTKITNYKKAYRDLYREKERLKSVVVSKNKWLIWKAAYKEEDINDIYSKN